MTSKSHAPFNDLNNFLLRVCYYSETTMFDLCNDECTKTTIITVTIIQRNK